MKREISYPDFFIIRNEIRKVITRCFGLVGKRVRNVASSADFIAKVLVSSFGAFDDSEFLRFVLDLYPGIKILT